MILCLSFVFHARLNITPFMFTIFLLSKIVVNVLPDVFGIFHAIVSLVVLRSSGVMHTVYI